MSFLFEISERDSKLSNRKFLPAAAASVATTGRSTSKTALARSSRLHRTGFVDSEVTAAHVGAAESRDCRATFVVGAHGDKSESAGAAGGAVHHDDRVGDGAVCAEDLAEVGVGC